MIFRIINPNQKVKKPEQSGFFALQRSDVFLEEVLEFFVGEHLVDELEDSLPVLVLELLDKPELFDRGLVLDVDFGGNVPVVCGYLVGGHVEELSGFVKLFDGDGPGSLFYFAVSGLVHADMGGHVDLFEVFLLPDCLDVVC